MENINRGISRNINIWGDSMAQGAGSSGGMGVGNNLLGLLNVDRVINTFGIGGQTSTQIATRFGAIPWYITAEGGSFGAVGVPINLTAMSSQALSTAADNTARFIDGTTLTNQGSAVVKQRCFISRSATGSAPNKIETYTISLVSNYFGANAPLADSIFIPNTGLNAIDDINIFWMGRNDSSYSTVTVANVTACVDYLANPKRFLVIGILPNANEINGNRPGVDAYNTIISGKYPDNFIETTPPTTEELAFIKYTPTSDELADITNGIFPRGMRPVDDITHLTSVGYRIMAYRVFKKFKQYNW